MVLCLFVASLLAPAVLAAESIPATPDQDASAPSHLLPITVLVLLALLVPGAILVLSWLLHRQGTGPAAKNEPYECGVRDVVGSASERFSVKYYLIAMLFLVFDIEVAFLYPFALQFTDRGGWGLLIILLVFLVMLEAAYLYLYRKGALDWER
ncbi:MAG: NADH-quinone oxidoreductase subunit A [Planctomycetota bacterium]